MINFIGYVKDRVMSTEGIIQRTREAREASEYSTQEKMADFLGIPRDTYKQYEQRTPLPNKHHSSFLKATNVSIGWLLMGDGDSDVPSSAKGQYSPSAEVVEIDKDLFYKIHGVITGFVKKHKIKGVSEDTIIGLSIAVYNKEIRKRISVKGYELDPKPIITFLEYQLAA